MKKRLLLIRHGQSQANKEGRVQGWLDSPLSELGHLHAQLVSRRIAAEFDVAHIFCSPLLRAKETALYLSQAKNLPLTIIDALKEQNLGPLSGLPKTEIKARYPHLEHAWTNNLPRPLMEGIESDIQFATRVQQAMDTILYSIEPGSIAAVISHRGTLNQMLKNWLKITHGGHLTFTFSNASLTIVDVYRTYTQVVVLNDTHHLGETHAPRKETHSQSPHTG